MKWIGSERTYYIALVFIAGLCSFMSCGGNPYRQGENLYNYYCANCHMENGEGLRSLLPPLAGSDYLAKHQEELPCIIRNGMEGPIVVNGKTFNQPMPGVPELNDIAIANIINYINQAWGNEINFVQIGTVQQSLEQCK